jgi:hypothetical protein
MVAAFFHGDDMANIGTGIGADIDTAVQTGIEADARANTRRASANRGKPPWRECMRGFIVPDDWPDRACAFAARAYHQR